VFQVRRNVLSYLSFANLCRLRLTARRFNDWTQESLQDKCTLRLEIKEATPGSIGLAMTAAGNLGLKIEELFLNNETEEFYNDPQFKTFISAHGKEVWKLKLSNYFVESKSQLKFLDGLPNVKEFKMDTINATKGIGANARHKGIAANLTIPAFFKSLRVLKFGVIHINSPRDTNFWYAMLDFTCCPELIHFRYPRVIARNPILGLDAPVKYKCLKDLITKQRSVSENNGLFFIDFKHLDNMDEMEFELEEFRDFVEFVEDLNLELLNVQAEYLQLVEVDYTDMLSCISSLMDYHPQIASLQLEGTLNSIRIKSVQRVVSNGWAEPAWNWCTLHSISIHFDCQMQDFRQWADPAKQMFEFLLVVNRLADTDEEFSFMEEFKLTFDPALLHATIPNSIVNGRLIADGLGLTLTKLTLVGWNPVNTNFIKLWEGLKLLETLCIENCPSLGNVGFIGTDTENPVFIGLKRKSFC